MIEMGLKDEERRSDRSRAGRSLEKNQDKIYNLVMDMLSYSKERSPPRADRPQRSWSRDVVELMAQRATEGNVKLEPQLRQYAAADPARPRGIIARC